MAPITMMEGMGSGRAGNDGRQCFRWRLDGKGTSQAKTVFIIEAHQGASITPGHDGIGSIGTAQEVISSQLFSLAAESGINRYIGRVWQIAQQVSIDSPTHRVTKDSAYRAGNFR